MTTVPLLCSIFRIYPEADPGGEGREVAIHYDPTGVQPALMLPNGAPNQPLIVSGLNGYLIARRDEGLSSDVGIALQRLFAGVGESIYVHVAAQPEMREFVSDDPEEVSMLLGRAGRLN